VRSFTLVETASQNHKIASFNNFPQLKMTSKISTGESSTLGTYRKISAVLTGENSPATKMLDDRIAKEGEDAEVIAAESQMIYLIVNMSFGDMGFGEDESTDTKSR
jgi:hypothetical protein